MAPAGYNNILDADKNMKWEVLSSSTDGWRQSWQVDEEES